MKIRMLAGADGTDNGMVDPNSARKPNGGKKMLPCHQHNDSADNLNMFLCVCVWVAAFLLLTCPLPICCAGTTLRILVLAGIEMYCLHFGAVHPDNTLKQ